MQAFLVPRPGSRHGRTGARRWWEQGAGSVRRLGDAEARPGAGAEVPANRCADFGLPVSVAARSPRRGRRRRVRRSASPRRMCRSSRSAADQFEARPRKARRQLGRDPASFEQILSSGLSRSLTSAASLVRPGRRGSRARGGSSRSASSAAQAPPCHAPMSLFPPPSASRCLLLDLQAGGWPTMSAVASSSLTSRRVEIAVSPPRCRASQQLREAWAACGCGSASFGPSASSRGRRSSTRSARRPPSSSTSPPRSLPWPSNSHLPRKKSSPMTNGDGIIESALSSGRRDQSVKPRPCRDCGREWTRSGSNSRSARRRRHRRNRIHRTKGTTSWPVRSPRMISGPGHSADTATSIFARSARSTGCEGGVSLGVDCRLVDVAIC